MSTDQDSSSNDSICRLRSVSQMLGLRTQSEFLASHTSARTSKRPVGEVESISIFCGSLARSASGRLLTVGTAQCARPLPTEQLAGFVRRSWVPAFAGTVDVNRGQSITPQLFRDAATAETAGDTATPRQAHSPPAPCRPAPPSRGCTGYAPPTRSPPSRAWS